jgi:predicted enzyme related to lactoylglutathione lyase
VTVVVPGRFLWHEVLTTDPDGALAFYPRVIGWTVMPWDADPSYRMFAWKNIPVAGVMLLPEEARQSGAPPHWLAYVSVQDVDAALARATGLGARTYVEPMDVPSVGRMAVLADPQGATFALYRPVTDSHVTDDMKLGDFSWHELAADDWKAAWDFYRALFGWEHADSFDMGPGMGTYWMFRRAGGSRTLGGMFNRPPQFQMASWLPYVHVKSADDIAAVAARHGGTVVYGPMDVPGGDRIAQILDPQGALFAVHSLAPVAAAPAAPSPAASPSGKAGAAPARSGAAKPAIPTAAGARGRPVKKKPAKKR